MLKNLFKRFKKEDTAPAVGSFIKNKKAILGLELAKEFFMGVLALVLVGFVVLIVANAMDSPAVQEATGNKSSDIITNVSSGISGFFDNIPLWMSILGIVILISLVVVIIRSVSGMNGQSNSGGL